MAAVLIRPTLATATAWLVLAGAAPAQAQNIVGSDYATAVKRLRGCLDAGVGGAPRDSLRSVVVAVRMLCAPQIKAAHAASDREVEADNPALAGNGNELAAQKRAAWAKLDNELVTFVANRTGIRN